jgi:acetylornithine deacetylase/succinyl-diaminopimelate desuccinylase-like protein
VAAAIDEHAVRHALALLVGKASPPGQERALAEAVAAWGRTSHPDFSWQVDPLDERSASLFARSALGAGAPELVVYGHLDTSLTGDAARDVGVTGLTTAAPPLRFDQTTRTLRGFGVGVAKAPSAAGLVAFAAAAGALRAQGIPHRLTLLLAAGGTHRAAPGRDTWPVRPRRGTRARQRVAARCGPEREGRAGGGPP